MAGSVETLRRKFNAENGMFHGIAGHDARIGIFNSVPSAASLRLGV